MRCPICDWEPGAPLSILTEGLSLPPIINRELRMDEKGEIICSCFNDPLDSFGETWDNEEEDQGEFHD